MEGISAVILDGAVSSQEGDDQLHHCNRSHEDQRCSKDAKHPECLLQAERNKGTTLPRVHVFSQRSSAQEKYDSEYTGQREADPEHHVLVHLNPLVLTTVQTLSGLPRTGAGAANAYRSAVRARRGTSCALQVAGRPAAHTTSTRTSHPHQMPGMCAPWQAIWTGS